MGWRTFDELQTEIAATLPGFAALPQTAPPASFRIHDQKVPREPARYSGRTAMLANVQIHEPKPPDDPDAPMSFTMEGAKTPAVPGVLLPRYWSPGWNSVQALNKFQEEGAGPLIGGNPGVRLLEPAGTGPSYFPWTSAPAPRWQIIPLHHIFGSDELSIHPPGIAERAPAPYLALSGAEAHALGGEDGSPLTLAAGDERVTLPVRVSASLPEGAVGVPVGLPGARVSPWLILIVVLLVVLNLAAILIWVERRMLALWQDRYGPNRVGPFGLLQPVADAVKLFAKEDWTPPFANRWVFVLAPAVIMVTMMMSFVVIPFAPGFVVADLNVGVLFFLGMSSLGVYSVVLGGWASNSKYSLIGGLRAAAQMLSYEVFMGLSLMGVVMMAGAFRLSDIVTAQERLWFVILQFLGFITFTIAGLAETHRLPFDLPEADSELIAGFHAEYSGMKFGMFFVGEYIGVTLISLMIVTLFFGGWQGPWLPPFIWFFLKTFVFIFFFILMRASLPRPPKACSAAASVSSSLFMGRWALKTAWVPSARRADVVGGEVFKRGEQGEVPAFGVMGEEGGEGTEPLAAGFPVQVSDDLGEGGEVHGFTNFKNFTSGD